MPDLTALPPAPTLLVTVLAFLLGSLVSGVLYSRARGADIRDRDLPGGSGTWRQFGRGAGILVSAGDILKGIVAALLARALVPQGGEALAALVTGAVVAGHCYPVFFGFRGGGGIAPLLGALLVFTPGVLLALLVSKRIALDKSDRKAMLGLVLYLVLSSLISGLTGSNVDNAAHVGGLVTGLFVAAPLVLYGLKARQV